MLATLAFLFVGMILVYVDQPFQVPLQCRFVEIVWNRGGTGRLNLFCAVLLHVYLFVIYGLKIRRLYDQDLNKYRARSQARRNHFIAAYDPRKASPGSNMLSVAGEILVKFNFTYMEFCESFLWEILWLCFGFFYGIRQLYWAKHYVGGKIIPDQSENDWGFGQLLALLLLALPVLAAIEARHGKYHDLEKEKESGF